MKLERLRKAVDTLCSHNLSRADAINWIAEALRVSRSTVWQWLSVGQTRPIPDTKLDLLEIKIRSLQQSVS